MVNMPSQTFETLFGQFQSSPQDPLASMGQSTAKNFNAFNVQISCLLDHVNFLEKVDQQDPILKSQFSRKTFEQDVISVFNQLEDNIRTLSQSAVPILKAMRHSNSLEIGFEQLRDGLRQTGSVQFLELMQETFEQQPISGEVNQLVSSENLQQLFQKIKNSQIQSFVDVQDEKLHFNIQKDQNEEFFVKLPDKNQQKTSLNQLIHQDDVDEILNAFLQGEIINAFVISQETQKSDTITIDDILVDLGLIPSHVLHERVRELEDVGLPVYQGNDGGLSALAITGLIIVGVGIAAALVGAALLIACNTTGDDDLCRYGLWTLTLGLATAATGLFLLSCAYGGCAIAAELAVEAFKRI
ncbi:hypothetical protein cce_1055 [Crocosphaera subtropica ATCC 51142]|uniref:Uncharacterized protein n=2 Tax=Crocosphaera TaxID=263510 RepID=B1WTU0_CROS5|nr:hypothetical protein cce_1055 [Crocosphaera subtropica ATCC 51142]